MYCAERTHQAISPIVLFEHFVMQMENMLRVQVPHKRRVIRLQLKIHSEEYCRYCIFPDSQCDLGFHKQHLYLNSPSILQDSRHSDSLKNNVSWECLSYLLSDPWVFSSVKPIDNALVSYIVAQFFLLSFSNSRLDGICMPSPELSGSYYSLPARDPTPHWL